jgi:hypothetical protein
VRPSYGSILVPLFEEDALHMGELARRARLSKQTMTTMVRLLERDAASLRATWRIRLTVASDALHSAKPFAQAVRGPRTPACRPTRASRVCASARSVSQ